MVLRAINSFLTFTCSLDPATWIRAVRIAKSRPSENSSKQSMSFFPNWASLSATTSASSIFQLNKRPRLIASTICAIQTTVNKSKISRKLLAVFWIKFKILRASLRQKIVTSLKSRKLPRITTIKMSSNLFQKKQKLSTLEALETERKKWKKHKPLLFLLKTILPFKSRSYRTAITKSQTILLLKARGKPDCHWLSFCIHQSYH